MRAKWYGDSRDLVKWGTLLHLSRRFVVNEILQIAYLRPDDWGKLEIDGDDADLPELVISHFRDIRAVTRLSSTPRVRVFDRVFDNRTEYLREIICEIKATKGGRMLLFLDPDTGLAPSPKKVGDTHVSESELLMIWRSLRPGDVLAFYQHQTNRNGQPWVDPKRLQFSNALQIQESRVKVASGRQIASDVAFFYCQK